MTWQVAVAMAKDDRIVCRAAAGRLLATAAPVALVAVTAHTRAEMRAESSSREVENATSSHSMTAVARAADVGHYGYLKGDDRDCGGDCSRSVDWWRRRLLITHGPSLYGPLQLNRSLRQLSGRVSAEASAQAQLFATCAPLHSCALRQLVRLEPQLGAWWSVMANARSLVRCRLRSRCTRPCPMARRRPHRRTRHARSAPSAPRPRPPRATPTRATHRTTPRIPLDSHARALVPRPHRSTGTFGRHPC